MMDASRTRAELQQMSEVTIDDGLDIAGLEERFGLFEDLHDGLPICAPMSGGDLDQVLVSLSVAEGDSVLDLACGTGESLIRLARRTSCRGLGVDLSPWMIRRAAQGAARRAPRASLRWHLGDAKRFSGSHHDVALCIGASWIWFGLAGTVRALTAAVRPGGMVAVGDLRRRRQPRRVCAEAPPGRIDSLAESEAAIRRAGLRIAARIDSDDESWDAYEQATARAVRRRVSALGAAPAAALLEEYERWTADQRRDRDLLSWSVWVGRV